MKYAFNSFVLEANIPVAIQGNDSLYTFQNITNSSITVLGSNNGTDWVSLCVVNAANAKTTHSAFKFLCINSGTLLVNRAAAGSSATTALVNESGTEVSSSNPLPVLSRLDPATASTQAALSGALSKCWISCPAVSAKYSAVQIWNPVGSGVNLLIIGLAGYNSSTSMKWYQHLNSTKLSTLGGYQQNLKSGNAALPFEMYYQNLDSKTATNALGVTVSSTAPAGGSLQLTGENICITEGYGLTYEADNANIGITMTAHIIASSNS